MVSLTKVGYSERMIQTLLLCSTLFFTSAAPTYTTSYTAPQQSSNAYTLELTLNGEPIDWYVSESVKRNGEWFDPNNQETVTILFDGGSLELNVADWGTWDYAHIMGVSYERTGADTYTMSATVRHDDAGWEDYANVIKLEGERVQNGIRELLHPHDNEQPFTRSQSGVNATGEVRVSANDNKEGQDGTVVVLALDSEMFTELESADLEIDLTRN